MTIIRPESRWQGFLPAAFVSAILCLLALLFSDDSQAQQRQLLDKVVAIVDEDVVLLSELDARLSEIRRQAEANDQPLPPEGQLREEVLDNLILENIQMQLADRVSIRYDDDTINRVLGNMAQNNGLTFDQYVATLEEAGVYLQTREEVRRQLSMQELQRGMVNQRIAVTEQEIDNFLNSEMGREVMAADYLVDHLLVPITANDSAEQREAKLRYAADLVARIEDGESLPSVGSQAARQGPYQLDSTNFGWRKAARLPNLFSDVVGTMRVGDVQGPIEAGNGFHVIQLADKRGGTEQMVNQTNLRHIMLSPNEIRTEEQTLAAIRELRQRILDGEDFASLARQNSDDASSVVAGGDLDWINEGGMPPEMEDVVDTLEVGELSEPFRTQTGWHIAEVLDRRETDLSRQYTRSQAANALRNRKFDLELQNWLLEIREEAFVEIVE
ncbi:MAG: peptidylprolyl isomerase [Pseudohongiellaceae bacterium]|jgi:peptidyl-prolyl cis-trans isomerase SurA